MWDVCLSIFTCWSPQYFGLGLQHRAAHRRLCSLNTSNDWQTALFIELSPPPPAACVWVFMLEFMWTYPAHYMTALMFECISDCIFSDLCQTGSPLQIRSALHSVHTVTEASETAHQTRPWGPCELSRLELNVILLLMIHGDGLFEIFWGWITLDTYRDFHLFPYPFTFHWFRFSTLLILFEWSP